MACDHAGLAISVWMRGQAAGCGAASRAEHTLRIIILGKGLEHTKQHIISDLQRKLNLVSACC